MHGQVINAQSKTIIARAAPCLHGYLFICHSPQSTTQWFTVHFYSLCSPCQPYYSHTCRNYIHEDTNVLVNNETKVLESTISKQIGLINTYTATHHANLTYMATGITEETIDQCSDFIRGIACNSVYPYCDTSSTNSHPVPRPLCKHTCDILRAEGFCSFFLDPSFLEEYRYQLSPLRDALFASCDNRTTPGGESPECIYVSLDSPAVGKEACSHIGSIL